MIIKVKSHFASCYKTTTEELTYTIKIRQSARLLRLPFN
nr:MAG TPA: hypothetical protein [Caudoviricetes sp.]